MQPIIPTRSRLADQSAKSLIRPYPLLDRACSIESQVAKVRKKGGTVSGAFDRIRKSNSSQLLSLTGDGALDEADEK
jgi:hypothetical protein